MFRQNVAALIKYNNLFLSCYRADHGYWQCVQGGVESYDSSFEAAIIREMEEELGVSKEDFKIIYRSRFWRRYFFSKKYNNKKKFQKNIGQEQLWFYIELFNPEKIQVENSSGEFSKVAFITLDEFLKVYSKWKIAPFKDFCHELSLCP